jgi:hypothetical protein
LHDLDCYSSTRDALKVLEAEPKHYLPRKFHYFDDSLSRRKINNCRWLDDRPQNSQLTMRSDASPSIPSCALMTTHAPLASSYSGGASRSIVIREGSIRVCCARFRKSGPVRNSCSGFWHLASRPAKVPALSSCSNCRGLRW